MPRHNCCIQKLDGFNTFIYMLARHVTDYAVGSTSILLSVKYCGRILLHLTCSIKPKEIYVCLQFVCQTYRHLLFDVFADSECFLPCCCAYFSCFLKNQHRQRRLWKCRLCAKLSSLTPCSSITSSVAESSIKEAAHMSAWPNLREFRKKRQQGSMIWPWWKPKNAISRPGEVEERGPGKHRRVERRAPSLPGTISLSVRTFGFQKPNI